MIGSPSTQASAPRSGGTSLPRFICPRRRGGAERAALAWKAETVAAQFYWAHTGAIFDKEYTYESDISIYLMSRGLDESNAYSLIVNGFIEPITKELPMEYAVELNRLIQLEMSGSVG